MKEYVTLIIKEIKCLIKAVSPQPASVTPTYSIETVSGSIPNGLYSYRIKNVGASNALVAGEILSPSEEIYFKSYIDPQTNEFKRLDGLSYDPQSSTLAITTTP